MQELDERFEREQPSADASRRSGLRLAVLAIAGAVVVGLMIALVGPGLGG